MLMSLLLPVVLSAVALFFASFLSWMILQIHKQDWVKIEKEDEVIAALTAAEVPAGNYMIPSCVDMKDMQSEEYTKKWEEGPRGTLALFGKVSMGRNLGLTFVYFLVVSFCLAYLAQPGRSEIHDRLPIRRDGRPDDFPGGDRATRHLVSLPHRRTRHRVSSVRGHHRRHLRSHVAGCVSS